VLYLLKDKCYWGFAAKDNGPHLSARNQSLTLFGHCNCCCCPLATATRFPTLRSTIEKCPSLPSITLCRRLASLKTPFPLSGTALPLRSVQNRTGTGTGQLLTHLPHAIPITTSTTDASQKTSFSLLLCTGILFYNPPLGCIILYMYLIRVTSSHDGKPPFSYPPPLVYSSHSKIVMALGVRPSMWSASTIATPVAVRLAIDNMVHVCVGAGESMILPTMQRLL
jgi:hypothetical protein